MCYRWDIVLVMNGQDIEEDFLQCYTDHEFNKKIMDTNCIIQELCDYLMISNPFFKSMHFRFRKYSC